uniref:RNase H domain-containing protein n=1 Tax=Echinococcus granulosus TaxID=6210 RepID=A0A068X4Z5_ECHGR|nr:hypothetical protein EgrG_002059800 [Echinococcus granulosus]
MHAHAKAIEVLVPNPTTSGYTHLSANRVVERLTSNRTPPPPSDWLVGLRAKVMLISVTCNRKGQTDIFQISQSRRDDASGASSLDLIIISHKYGPSFKWHGDPFISILSAANTIPLTNDSIASDLGVALQHCTYWCDKWRPSTQFHNAHHTTPWEIIHDFAITTPCDVLVVVVVPAPTEQKTKFTAFNVRIFGETKSEISDVMKLLAKIFTRYEAAFMEEIRDKMDEAIQILLAAINSASP